MTKQMELLQKIVTERDSKHSKINGEHSKLTRLTDADDIESFLTTFERLMQVYEIDSARWAFTLAPQLTGKAQQVYAALSSDEAQDYNKVKAAILCRYNINDETYRRRFRGLKFKQGHTPTEIATRLQDLASKWLRDCTTADEVRDMVVNEKLLTTLPQDIRVWVTERKPKSTEEAAQLAEDYLQARPQGTITNAADRLSTGPCPRYQQHGHWARHCHKHYHYKPNLQPPTRPRSHPRQANWYKR